MISSFRSSYGFGRRPLTILNPTNLPSGFVWLNADLGSATNFGSALTDGSTVSTWKDVYAGAHDANKSGNASVKPIWKSNIQNGYGVVRFDGSNDSLNINPVNSPAPSLQSASAFSLFAVARASSLGSTRCMTATDTGGYKIFHNGSFWSVSAAEGTAVSGSAGNTTGFHIFTLLYNGSATGNSNRVRFRYDSAEQSLNFGASTAGTLTNANAQYFYVAEDSGVNFFAGDVAEIILYVRAFTASEVTAEEAYLKSHWGL